MSAVWTRRHSGQKGEGKGSCWDELRGVCGRRRQSGTMEVTEVTEAAEAAASEESMRLRREVDVVG
jgi:hypothetical protein